MNFSEEYMRAIWSRLRTYREMSNYDHTIDEDMEKNLRAGMISVHTGLYFNGACVWYDEQEDLFFEQVWVHHIPVAILDAPSLERLMEKVNDTFGWA